MIDEQHARKTPTVADRREGRKAACWNVLHWAIGNGLVGRRLISYLIQEAASTLQAAVPIGTIVSLVFAAPQLAGLLRLAAPRLIDLAGGRKRLCVGAYLLSSVALATVPAMPLLFGRVPPIVALLGIALAWCVYHLFEYCGTVALWSWLRDLVSTKARGRFIAMRERWLLSAKLTAMGVAAAHAWAIPNLYPDAPRWLPYTNCAAVGAVIMALAVVPLLRMPSVATERSKSGEAWRDLLRPLGDPMLRRLMLFGCWLSFSNGVTQAAQGIYPYTLGISFTVMLAFEAWMLLGQAAMTPMVGRWADRFGNRRLMLIALPIVATGPLFYLLAGLVAWQFLCGAWTVWIAWVAVNVSLANLLLRISPSKARGAAHIATYYAFSGLCYGLSTLLGGFILDVARSEAIAAILADSPLNIFEIMLILGWFLRTSSVLLVLWIVREPSKRAIET